LTDEALDFMAQNNETPFFMYFAHYAVHTPIQAKQLLKEKYQKKPSSPHHDHPSYAAMIESVDESLGRLLNQLHDLQIADQTIIVFFSDNGGHGGITSNFPLRGSKGMLYEGGIRVPMIAWYPGEIPAKTSCDEPVIGLDFYPTFMDLADLRIGDVDLDGESLLPLFDQPASTLHRKAIYWHFPAYLEGYQNIKHPENLIDGKWRATPSAAIRMGDWKLIEYFENGHCQLFNLKEDIGEENDLFEHRPDMAQLLLKEMHEWRKLNHADMPKNKTHLN